jgi:hypothetical protein
MEYAMTDTPITLPTGQTATLEEGVMRVTTSAPPRPARGLHHYKMTARHEKGGLLDVRTAEIDDAMAFLKQLEPLGYTLRNIVRVAG